MKRRIQLTAFVIPLFILIAALFTGCEAIGSIFKAGMGVGVFIVLAVVVLVIFLISRFAKK